MIFGKKYIPQLSPPVYLFLSLPPVAPSVDVVAVAEAFVVTESAMEENGKATTRIILVLKT